MKYSNINRYILVTLGACVLAGSVAVANADNRIKLNCSEFVGYTLTCAHAYAGCSQGTHCIPPSKGKKTKAFSLKFKYTVDDIQNTWPGIVHDASNCNDGAMQQISLNYASHAGGVVLMNNKNSTWNLRGPVPHTQGWEFGYETGTTGVKTTCTFRKE